MLRINKSRSHYTTNPEILTTFDCSYLIPLKTFKVIPNGVYKISAGSICRLPALKVPVMGKLWMDFFAFYVPYDLLDKKFEKFITEGHDNTFDEDVYGKGSHTPNTQSVGKTIVPDLFSPKLVSKKSKDGFEVFSGDLLNRLGLPIANAKKHKENKEYNEKLYASLCDKNGVMSEENKKIYAKKKLRDVPAFIENGKYSAFPLRAYYEIINKHFRSKFLEDPKPIDYGSSESDPADYRLERVNRTGDWFSRGFITSQLNPVQIPLGFGELPVEGKLDEKLLFTRNVATGYETLTKKYYDFANTSGNAYIGKLTEWVPQTTRDTEFEHYEIETAASGKEHGVGTKDVSGPNAGYLNYFVRGYDEKDISNLKVNLANAIALGLNDIRYVVGLSHISEKALYGTDMATLLKLNFNLTLPRTCLDEPYLFGYKRIPVEINQVTQTAPDNSGETNIGDVYGQSTTVSRLDDGSFSFRAYNYGLIMLCCCIRHESVYQYGIDSIFLENDKFDLFQPDLQGLSNVGIPKKTIYYSGTSKDDDVFNFNEPYADLKHDHNVVNGEFSSDSDTPLDFYTLADIYNDTPNFDANWIKDTTREVIDRALTINSSVQNQVHAYFKLTYDRTLPMSDYFVGFDYI